MKKWLIGGVLIGVLALAVSLFWHEKSGIVMEEPAVPVSAVDDTLASLEASLAVGKSMECTYAPPGSNGRPSFFHMEGEHFHGASLEEGRVNRSVFDGSAYYSWTEGAAEGEKLEKVCAEELRSRSGEVTGLSLLRDPIVDMSQAEGVHCQEVPRAEIQAPPVIAFVDQCEGAKQSVQMMQDMQKLKNPQEPGTEGA